MKKAKKFEDCWNFHFLGHYKGDEVRSLELYSEIYIPDIGSDYIIHLRLDDIRKKTLYGEILILKPFSMDWLMSECFY